MTCYDFYFLALLFLVHAEYNFYEWNVLDVAFLLLTPKFRSRCFVLLDITTRCIMLKRFSFSLSHSQVKFAQFFVGLEPLDCILYYFISSVKFILLPPYNDHEYFD